MLRRIPSAPLGRVGSAARALSGLLLGVLALGSSCATAAGAKPPPVSAERTGADTSSGSPAAAPAAAPAHQLHGVPPEGHEPSLAYRWLEVVLEVAARDVERVGPRPTILSRQMAIPIVAMYEAWACYDERALGTLFGGALRRPPDERTAEARATAIGHAVYRAALDQFPAQADALREAMRALGQDPDLDTRDARTSAGLGAFLARTLVASRHADGANQLGDEPGSDGTPYADYTMYRPVNTPERVLDPDRWQPIPFDDGQGGTIVPGFLTPHWYRVRPFGLPSAGAFRPGPPPLVGSPELAREVDECIAFNAALDPEQKAIVEFMRDGPRSTGQSGHWLRFAQDVSARDRNDLDRDVPLFLAVATTAMDAFIASWEAKRFYDSSRPWTLVRWLHAGETLAGWGGPGRGTIEIPAERWHPYSPATFVTPPFPGYPSGHSTVSGACAEILRLWTGSDVFDVEEARRAGALTEDGFPCATMQRVLGRLPALPPGAELTCDVRLPLPTFTATAEMAGLSRVLGGYHIASDNTAGLALGRDVARCLYPKLRALVEGDAGPPQE